METLKKWEEYESYEKYWDMHIIIGLNFHSPVICDTSLYNVKICQVEKYCNY